MNAISFCLYSSRDSEARISVGSFHHATCCENRNLKNDQFWLYFVHRLEDYADHMKCAVQEELEKKISWVLCQL